MSFLSQFKSSSLSSSSSSWFSGVVRGRSERAGSVKMGADSLSGGSGDNSSSVVRKNQFRGVLFKYGPKPIQVAFKTGDYRQQVIFIGGLSDGFLATEYVEPLAISLDKEKCSLVQPLLSSSYSGYGTSSLKQDIVHCMRTIAACSRAVRAAILPVSCGQSYSTAKTFRGVSCEWEHLRSLPIY